LPSRANLLFPSADSRMPWANVMLAGIPYKRISSTAKGACSSMY